MAAHVRATTAVDGWGWIAPYMLLVALTLAATVVMRRYKDKDAKAYNPYGSIWNIVGIFVHIAFIPCAGDLGTRASALRELRPRWTLEAGRRQHAAALVNRLHRKRHPGTVTSGIRGIRRFLR